MDNWEMKSWIRELDIVEMNNYWTMKVGVMFELCEFVARLDVIKLNSTLLGINFKFKR